MNPLHPGSPTENNKDDTERLQTGMKSKPTTLLGNSKDDSRITKETGIYIEEKSSEFT